MKITTKRYLRGISLMAGMAIGVGLFGVPYALSKSGALVGLAYFIILGLLVIFTNLIYGEALLRTKGQHRLAGLCEIYIGRGWKWFSIVLSTFGFYAVLVAYIILGGQFLKMLLSPFLGGSLILYQVIFWAAMSMIVFLGMKTLAVSEIFMTAALLLAMTVVTSAAAAKMDAANWFAQGSDFFMPYGVILFAITAAAAVPEVLETMRGSAGRAKSAIFWGSFLSVALIAVFSFAVLGATGGVTSPDAVEGLGRVLGGWVVYLGAAFGLLAVATSFLPVALYAKEQFIFDFKINGVLSWAISCIVPFFIFLFGTRDFIKIISFSGAVFAGLEGFLIAWIYWRAKHAGGRKPEYEVKLPLAILAVIGLIFILGMVYEIGTFF